MAITTGGYMAFVVPAKDRGGDTNDFRNVPRTDRDPTYRDRGMFGNYAPTSEPYPAPAETRFFTGFAGDEEDLRRGWCVPAIREDPAYDKVNYQDRWTQPREPNEDMGETDVMRADWEFRGRNQRSRGFLPRPRVPTERG
jgi:hypothetical protein